MKKPPDLIQVDHDMRRIANHLKASNQGTRAKACFDQATGIANDIKNKHDAKLDVPKRGN